jgi:DNA-binding transcriptional LysR family regulator
MMVFAAIFEAGNIANAARRLGIEPSSAYEAFGRFKSRFGENLFFKDTPHGPLRPTARCIRLYHDYVKPVVDKVSFLQTEHAGTGPLLRVGASDYIFREYLTRILATFARRVPHLRLATFLGCLSQVEDQLHDGALDLAILAVDEPSRQFTSQELLQVPVTLVAPADCTAKTAEELLANLPANFAYAYPPPEEGVTRRFQTYQRERGRNPMVRFEPGATAFIPFFARFHHAVGPCAMVPSLIGGEGVKSLPLPAISPLKVIAAYNGQARGVSRSLLAAIDELAREEFGRALAALSDRKISGPTALVTNVRHRKKAGEQDDHLLKK